MSCDIMSSLSYCISRFVCKFILQILHVRIHMSINMINRIRKYVNIFEDI